MCLIFEQYLTFPPKKSRIHKESHKTRSPEFVSSAIENEYSSAWEFRKLLVKIMYYYYNLK